MCACALLLAVLMAPKTAAAQAPAAAGGKLEVSAAVTWSGGIPLGSTSATLTPNQSGGTRFTLFKTETSLTPAAGFEGRLAYRLTRILAIEAGLAYGAPVVETAVSGDAENPDATPIVEETLAQFVVDAALVAHVRRLSFLDGRAVPFARAGGGYLRQLHEGQAVVDTGQVYHVGGGLTYLVASRPRGLPRRFGLRADARVVLRVKGFALDERPRVFSTVSAGAFVGF